MLAFRACHEIIMMTYLAYHKKRIPSILFKSMRTLQHR